MRKSRRKFEFIMSDILIFLLVLGIGVLVYCGSAFLFYFIIRLTGLPIELLYLLMLLAFALFIYYLVVAFEYLHRIHDVNITYLNDLQLRVLDGKGQVEDKESRYYDGYSDALNSVSQEIDEVIKIIRSKENF